MIRVEQSELKCLTPQQTAALVERRLAHSRNEADDWTPTARLPTIGALDAVLPAGLPRGAVADYHGSLSLLLGMLATASAAGLATALVNQPSRPGTTAALLAAHEMGGDLANIAVIETTESRVLEVANVLLDGIALVIAATGSATLPPSRTKVLVKRAHQHECTLVIANGQRRCQGADLQLTARCIAAEGLGRGRGRLRAQTFAVEAIPKRGRRASGVLRLAPQPGQARTDWTAVGIASPAEVIDLSTKTG